MDKTNNTHEIIHPYTLIGLKNMDDKIISNLNPDYTFDNFIQGVNNKYACDCLQYFANFKSMHTNNIYFLYGKSGIGKTHLVHAFGNVLYKTKNESVIYFNCSDFNDLFEMQKDDQNYLNSKNYFKNCDCLILDDIQSLEVFTKSQDALFHIFNHLHSLGKKIIITSNKTPANLRGFDQRLLSRMKWGLFIEINKPDYDNRVAIITHKAKISGFQLDENIIDCIAKNVISSVSEIEGVLISLFAKYVIDNCTINIDLVNEVLEELNITTNKEISINYILKIVTDYFNLSEESIHLKTRKREIVQARQIAMYFSKTLTKSSLATIGSKIGGKNHATVLHACKTVNNLMETDKKYKFQIDEIEKKLKIL